MCSSRSCFGVAGDGAPISSILGALVHREQRDLAQIFLAGEQHHDAVDARRDAAVRRRAVVEGAIHAAEFLDQHVLAVAGDLEGLAA